MNDAARGPAPGGIALADLDAGGVLLSIDVTNTSARRGDEVVQVYLEGVVASVAPPVRRLVAFERRSLAPGETEVFSFTMGREQLGFWQTDAASPAFAVEPGLFRLHVGPTLDRCQSIELRVLRDRG
ncbi:MAG TPA: fibronectin type III-like domain-contianing protein [Microbacterium sp.]|nr:fibronectin type III-like domain-contianing protein [Microbacterium sp.]